MEVKLPAYELTRPPVSISVHDGSTRTLGFKVHPFTRRLYRHMRRPLRVSSGYVHDARYETDANVAHIIENVAPKLLLVEELRANLTVILSSSASQIGRRVYETLGFRVICTDRDVEGQLVLATSGVNGVYEPWNKTVFPSVSLDWCRDTPRRVFIARRDRRRLVNSDEIETQLRRFGFTTLYFEDLPVAAQWTIARNAEAIVAIHGAAVSSVVFNDSGIKVVELFHPGYVVDSMRHKVAANHGSWCGVTGRITPEVIRELDQRKRSRAFAYQPITIDRTSLCMALEFLGVS
jgi:capsular polysaccharide biosynthesis protein